MGFVASVKMMVAMRHPGCNAWPRVRDRDLACAISHRGRGHRWVK